MLPPGLSFNAVSDKAFEASRSNRLMRSYWDWSEMQKHNPTGFFPYTPGTNLLFGLREAIAMLEEEGLPNVFARHARHAKPLVAPFAGGGSRSCARIRRSTATRLPPSLCRPVTTPTVYAR
jgi:alanine-glyoxylate transaminase/serine-glyoxylate transaminase/serine-pyruvate transaminase